MIDITEEMLAELRVKIAHEITQISCIDVGTPEGPKGIYAYEPARDGVAQGLAMLAFMTVSPKTPGDMRKLADGLRAEFLAYLKLISANPEILEATLGSREEYIQPGSSKH